MAFAKGGRVKCLATRFNAEPDRNGLLFSDLRLQAGLGNWVHGAIKHVYVRRGRAPQRYKALYDGDSAQSASAGSRLMALEQDGDYEESSDDDEADQTSPGSSEDPLASIDNARADSENEDGDAPLGGGPGAIAMGETTECGGLTSRTCSIHPGAFCCRSAKALTRPERDCWQRRLQSHNASYI